MRILGKLLQALGIAEVMIGLVTGLRGDMKQEMYFALAGVLIFTVGWAIQRWSEKKGSRHQESRSSTPTES